MRRFVDLEVQLYDVQEAPDYIIRKLDVSKRSLGSGLCEENREIVHIQYTSWPDRSAPADPGALLQLIDLTRALDSKVSYLLLLMDFMHDISWEMNDSLNK